MDSTDLALVNFGRKLTEVREERGMSVLELASTSGLSLPFVAGMEDGSLEATLLHVSKLAAALGVDAADLLAGLDT